MSALSIRKLPRDLDRALRREAKVKGRTKTEIVLEALAERFHLHQGGKARLRFREFFGQMTREEFEAFQQATKDFSNIEEGLWS